MDLRVRPGRRSAASRCSHSSHHRAHQASAHGDGRNRAIRDRAWVRHRVARDRRDDRATRRPSCRPPCPTWDVSRRRTTVPSLRRTPTWRLSCPTWNLCRRPTTVPRLRRTPSCRRRMSHAGHGEAGPCWWICESDLGADQQRAGVRIRRITARTRRQLTAEVRNRAIRDRAWVRSRVARDRRDDRDTRRPSWQPAIVLDPALDLAGENVVAQR